MPITALLPRARARTPEEAKTGANPAGPGSPFFRDEPRDGQRLPKLREALADPAFRPVDAMTVPVPDEVLSVLRSAKRVLVVAHTAPDGDAVGSVLGLSRALKMMGKEVTPIIDDELPGQLRAIPGSEQARRFGDAEAAQTYDLVVMVDVAQAARIGRAAEALKTAPQVLVIDHHQTEPTQVSLAMKADAKLTTWVEQSADAAALLVAGVTDRLLSGVPLTREQAMSVTGPELAGMFTDSGGFSYPGVDGVSMAIFKNELITNYDGGLEAFEQTIHYDLPDHGQQLLSAPPRLEGLPEPLLVKAQQLLAKGISPRLEDAPGGGRMLVVPQEFFDLALEAARLSDSAVVKNDVVGQLKRQVGRAMDDTHTWAALVFGEDGKTYVSARSREAGPAVRLAETLGGGGHERAAGAQVSAPVESVVERVKAWGEKQAKP